MKEKRSSGLDEVLDVVQSVCPSESEWRALDTALDINNTVVRVYQPPLVATPGGSTRHLQAPLRQWFYTVTCRNEVMASRRHCPGCCLAVDHARWVASMERDYSRVLSIAPRGKQATHEKITIG